MWKVAIALLTLSETILGASIFHCPEGAICLEQGAIESSSFKFLDKLGPKQYQAVIKLTVSNASLDKVPAELKYLKMLEYLDLSNNNIQVSSIPSLPHLKVLNLRHNNIKGLSLNLLPKNIEDLDLSNNLLSHIPKDWSLLKSLKILHLNKNLIDCDCYSNNVLTYGKILKEGISIPEQVTCYLPKHFSEKDITSIHCSTEDEMINDQPEEGSGAGAEDIFRETTSSPQRKVPYLQEEENVEENEVIDDKDDLPLEEDLAVARDVTTTAAPEEGSGDEGSGGFEPIEIEHIPACIFNCATPEPVGLHDGNDTSPQPGPTDQLKIVAQDVFGPIFGKEKPLSSTTETEALTTSISNTFPPPPVEVIEEIIGKEVNVEVFKETDKGSETEVFSNQSLPGEMEKMEKATALNQNNYAVYIVVACGLLLAVVFLVCLIKKRKSKRVKKNRREMANGFGEEMKPLEKPSIQPVNEKNGKTPNNLPEHIPLMGELNGKSKEDPVLISFTPLEHPESFLTNGNGPETDFDEPELREKPELLTPTRERVTIRASEIPDSLPKTPVLVHRQKNSDGEIIVTTVVPP